MARVQDPILFSAYFKFGSKLLDEAGLIDPFINVDTQLFIDPTLLEKSTNQTIATDAARAFRSHFENFVRLIDISERVGDAAWLGAKRLLDLSEPPENGLGYGGSGRSGSSRPEEIRLSIMKTAKEITDLGIKDPEMISLMGFFEEKVGPDTISDFTSRSISNQLKKITIDFCLANSIQIQKHIVTGDWLLPLIKVENKVKPLVLVPKDIVRALPIAADWSDIEAAVFQNSQIRNSVNSLLAGIAKPTVLEKKRALREVALKTPRPFQFFMDAVKEYAKTYDTNEDALAYYKLKSIIADGFPGLPTGILYDFSKGASEVKRLAHDTISAFKRHVEDGNLWEELWIGSKPKKERAAQLIYYAIADVYCRANNVDIFPEANMGGGPIDFKFSKGYNSRVLVEMKRSSGTVVHGYGKQLEFYLNASSTDFGIFVVMDFGDTGKKLNDIYRIQRERIKASERASDIVVINARKKPSASKRS